MSYPKPDRAKIHIVPGELRRMSIVLGNTLHIWVGANLNDIERERYIQTKHDHYGIPRRRRRLSAFFPFAGGHAAHSKAAMTTAVAGGGALAIGVAAATILPSVLDGNQGSASRRPPAAAPAPERPRPPSNGKLPAASPSKPPRQPDEPAKAPPGAVPIMRHKDPLVRTVPVSLTRPHGVPSVNVLPPKAPTPPKPTLPPVSRKPSPVLAVSLPPAGMSVRLSPRLTVHVRIGAKSP